MRLLLIDDHQESLNGMSYALQLFGHQVIPFLSPIPALSYYKNYIVDAIISDFHLNIFNGIELLDRIRRINPASRFILITGDKDERIKKEALEKGVDLFFHKPLDIEQIHNKLEQLQSDGGGTEK